MVCDYEAAWVALQAFVATKTQHGREGLLAKMAELVQDCRVPAGELSRLLRLYGIEVERVRSLSESQDVTDGFDGGFVSPTDASHPGHDRTEEVHCGGSNGIGAGTRRAA